MILADAIAQLIGGLIGALIQAAGRVQWRHTTRIRPIRPLWRRLWNRVRRTH